MGLFLSLLVILGTRTALGEDEFAAWGWRIPFLVSIALLAISVWIRMSMNESPAFKKMKEEGIYKGFDCDLTQGDSNWPAIMKALDSIGYTGWAISEQRGGINPNGLRMLVERMDKIFAM